VFDEPFTARLPMPVMRPMVPVPPTLVVPLLVNVEMV
jgi:hypothetical protein